MSAQGSKSSLAKLYTAEVDDLELAVGDHLVGDFDKQASHALVGVVVARNSVNHLDGIHKGGQGLLNALGSAFIEGLNEFLKCLEVLDVVFSFIEGFSDAELDASPLAGGKVNFVARFADVVVAWLGSGGQHVKHSAAILGAQLFGNLGQLSHPLLPVFKLLAGASFFVFLLLGVGFFKSLLDFFGPLVEDFFEVGEHGGVGLLPEVKHAMGGGRVIGGVGLKDNVGLERSQCLLHVFRKLVKGLDVLFLLVLLANSPVSRFEFFNEGLVDVVYDGVESSDGLVTDLSKEHLVVVLSLAVDCLAGRGASHEVDTLAP